MKPGRTTPTGAGFPVPGAVGERGKPMLTSVRHLEEVAREWKINPEDVLLIALNSCGARSPLDKPRMRFQLALDSRPADPSYLILSLGREDSPFEIDEHELRLHGVALSSSSDVTCRWVWEAPRTTVG
ncbi:hypothetical protein [Streptomyces sp. NBC_01768]|uniref:hypothetical protein n=1 Tax=Streptomyces sp. NBC_01768 TaxID=2975938 RepID=UPI002DD92C56|nr:hypothetical protein [Streptomyces sp. NBC_01768]WSC32149.1 hypothetical protein OG902_38740 [Streptomyces sp. NBC_01768]